MTTTDWLFTIILTLQIIIFIRQEVHNYVVKRGFEIQGMFNEEVNYNASKQTEFNNKVNTFIKEQKKLNSQALTDKLEKVC